jgi:Family of unknown function (DUF5683)
MLQIFRFCMGLCCFSTCLFAQIDSTKYRNPKSALRRAILPTGGQFYNQQPVKGGIFAVGILGATGAFVYNQRTYKQYQKAYLYKANLDALSAGKDSLITTSMANRFALVYALPKYKDRTAVDLLGNRVKFRRYRDIAVLSTIGVYGLSILDAYISAQLSDFDIGENLSLKLLPHQPHKVLHFRFNIK